MFLNRLATYSAMALIAAGASASAGTFVSEGQLFTAGEDHKAVVRNLPVEPFHAFGTAEDQLLFTVQQIAPAAHTDVMQGEMNLWTELDGAAFALTSEEIVLGAQWSKALDRVIYWTHEKKVVLIDRQGGSREELLQNAITPSLSPDGLELAYVLTPEVWAWDDHSRVFEIHVRNLLTGKDRVLLRGTDAHELVWTPDGRFVLFQSSGTGVTSLFRVSAAGDGESQQLTNRGLWSAKSPFFVENPSRSTDVQWSEDGRKMLYGATYSDAGEIMVLTFDPQYDVRQAIELTYGHSPVWQDNDTVLVPRPGMVDLSKAADPAPRYAEFPVDTDYAKSFVDVASAPQEFQKPAALTDSKALPTKAVSRYRYPLHSTAGHPFTAYYDNNGGGGKLDWKCGGATYNNHRGTDIGVNGWWVYAGAYGTLNNWNDGCPTTGYYGSSCGGGFGNYIKLSHGSASGRNWYTTYAHFRNGTVKAQAHNCGSRVGISGSSGNSTGPHLHFQVDAYGHPNDDPFSGSCSGPVSYWCNQNGGAPTSSCC